MGGSTPPTTTQTTQQQLSPEQQQVFNMAMPYITQYAQQPIQQFGGTGIAPLNPLEQQAQQQYLTQAAPAAQTLATQAAGTQGQLLDPNFMLNPNQYVKAAGDAVANTATTNLNENILPGIRDTSQAAGGLYSGGATRGGIAEGKAAGDTGRAISNSLADMYFKNYTTGLGQMGEAVRSNPGVMQQQLFPADITAAVGAQQRSEEQARLDEQVRNFYTAQDLPLLQSQQLMQLIQGMPQGPTTGTVTGSVPKANPWMQALGLGMTGVGYGMGGPIGGAVGGAAAKGLTGGGAK